MFKRNSGLKIVSLLAAVCLWLYVTGEVDPEMRGKVSDIPVTLINTETLTSYGLAAAYDEELTISATISGPRSDVNDAKRNGLTAYVDVSECEKGKNEERIVVNLPDGLSLENISQSTVSIKVEDRITEARNVEIDFDTKDTSNDSVNETVPQVLNYYPETVTVSGAKSSVGKVKRVIGTIEANKAVEKKSKWVDVELVPVNNKGKRVYGVELSFSKGEAEIQRLAVKEVSLKLSSADKGETIDRNNIDIPDKIKIAGEKSAIVDIQNVEGIITEDNSGKISISVDLPENIYLLIGEDDGKIIWN